MNSNNIDIFVENYKLDLDDVDFELTYSFSDLTNVTLTTGDYSKTINLKGNQVNNEIFGQIWKLDRSIYTANDVSINAGIYYNASKRASCTIYINNEIFKKGYVKLNSIKIEKGVISYEITFYSKLCDVLHTIMSKKLVDLNYPNNLKHIINRNTIYDFWNNDSSLSSYMTYIMANNGLYENFESDKMIEYSGGYQVVDALNEIELDECAKGEYRSYYQRPALTVKGIINQIVEDYNASSDVSINLSNTFFNENNPYYENSVMTLPQLNVEEVEKQYAGENVTTFSLTVSKTTTPSTALLHPFTYSVNNESDLFTDSSIINISEISGTSSFNVEMEISLEYTYADTIPVGAKVTNINNTLNNGAVAYSAFICDSNKNKLFTLSPYSSYDSSIHLYDKIGYCTITNSNNGTSSGVVTFYNPYGNYKNGNVITWLPIHFHADDITVTNDEISICIQAYYIPSTNSDMAYWYLNSSSFGYTTIQSVLVKIRPITKAPTGEVSYNANDYYPANGINFENAFTGNDIVIYNNSQLTSNSKIDKYDMIDNEITQGDFLISYCKLFGIIYDVDNQGNITLTDRNNYFKDYQVMDWENKIDYSSTITQTPITFDKNFIEIKYTESDTYYEDYYKNKYKIEYGTAKVDTGYQFNTDSSNLIDGTLFNNTIVSKEKTRMLIGADYVFLHDDKVLPALFKMENNSRNPSSSAYNLLFNNGLQNLDNSQYIWITDSSVAMIDASGGGQYCWINTNNSIAALAFGRSFNKYPQYSTQTSDGNFSWCIGYPRENYANLNINTFPSTSTIYSKFWSNYFDEIYNVDNKIIKCKVFLTPSEMCQFSFRNFVKAFGCLWHVNAVNNFNPLSNDSTEVEMIKVSNINAYVNGQYTFQN